MKISSLNFVWIGIILALIVPCSTAVAAITNEGVTKLVDIDEDSNPSYSPEGKKIVFCTSPYTDHNSASMWILDLETNEMTKINVPDSHWLYYSTWNPGGNKILFTDSTYGIQSSGRVYIINLDGSNKNCLTCDHDIGAGNADMNPDGTKIVYSTTYASGSRGDIWIMNSDGSGKTQLTDQGGYESSPVFSPDGSKIAYSAGTEPNKQIWVMDADGNNKIRLTFNSQMEGAPAWSPNGDYIAYQKSVGVGQPWNIWVMKADGSEQTQLTDYSKDGIDGGSPDWSPDGNKLVFVSGGMNSNPMNTDWDIYEMTLGKQIGDFTVTEASDGVIVETPRVKYHLANGGFARELWVDHNGDGLYDENIGFEDTTNRINWAGFGSWYIITENGDDSGQYLYRGSVYGGDYSHKIIEIDEEKLIVDFNSDFDGLNAKTRWQIYPNGDAKVIPWTSNPLESTYGLGFTWYISPEANDIVGMYLNPGTELTSTVTFTGTTEIANPSTGSNIQRQNADFSDINYSNPYQFYKDSADEYSLLIVEPKVNNEEEWEWIECDQANDAIFGGRLTKDIDPTWPMNTAAGLLDWFWFADHSPENGGYDEPLESPTTQPINQDKKFAFYVHLMWGDTTEAQRYQKAGEIAGKLAPNKPPVANAGGSYHGYTNIPVTLNAGNSHDPNGDALQYRWDFENDGIWDTQYSTNSTAVHIWSGVYSGSVAVEVSDGTSTDIEIATVTITNDRLVIVSLKDSNGAPLSGGIVQYYSSGWKEFGTTDSNGQASKELPIGTYSFRMTYAYGSLDKAQNVELDSNVTFQTVNANVQLKDSNGNLIDIGTVQYYASGWRSFGTTSGGIATKELLPISYPFRMTYEYGSVDKSQNIATDPTVMFQTVNTNVQLKDSNGNLIDTGTVQYYANGWRTFGTTSGGIASKELLPMNYPFRMTYTYGSVDKSQNIATDPTVIFQTVNANVQLKDSNGNLIDTGTVEYYANGWRTFGTTSGGIATKELLPINYPFRMTYAYGSVDKSQNIATDPIVVYSTGKVVSDSGACTQYYAGGWHTFFNGIELMPTGYTFRFNDGTSDTSYVIVGNTENHIH